MTAGDQSDFILASYMRIEAAPLWLALLSATMLAAAYSFQYIGGLAPCELCLEQRVPHWGAIFIGFSAYSLTKKARWTSSARLTLLLALIYAIGAYLAGFHTGVELHWWQGPTTCTANSAMSGGFDSIADQLMNAPIVSCDQVAWSLFGISMAGYNFLISLAAMLLALWAAITFWQRRSLPHAPKDQASR